LCGNCYVIVGELGSLGDGFGERKHRLAGLASSVLYAQFFVVSFQIQRKTGFCSGLSRELATFTAREASRT
jgi:hypothetical protein